VFHQIESEHLVLRRLHAADAARVFAYRSLPEVKRYQGWEPRDELEVARFIESLDGIEPGEPGRCFQIGITLKTGGELIGDCALVAHEGREQELEAGITLAPAYQGKGHATEALGAVLGFAFAAMGKHRVFCSVDPANAPSVRLLERLGMRREAHHRKSLWFKGAWVDDVIYAMLAEEWVPPGPPSG
jgi:RimJ/RimL family protein N-acetyltransferase